MLLSLGLAACTTTLPSKSMLTQPDGRITPHSGPVLKIITLNLAHGRKDGVNQLFLGRSTIQNNVGDIAAVLAREDADVVALQEADGPSRWSGGFDHVEALAEKSGYAAVLRAGHAVSWWFEYGTALLSKTPFKETLAHTFQPSPPTLNKGLVLGQIIWQPDPRSTQAVAVDIISVHLDFSRKKIREQQIEEVQGLLQTRDNPTIIMGDFNSDWFADEKVIRSMARRSQLLAYRPEAADLGTYDGSGRRLDWILISRELYFIDYRVLPDNLSDHQAVAAIVGLKKHKQLQGIDRGIEWQIQDHRKHTGIQPRY